MVRETSKEAWMELVHNGKLSEKRREVYKILFMEGPLTGAQVKQIYSDTRYGLSNSSETIRNRLTELRNFGVVKECGVVKCPITGNKVILWDVTSNYNLKKLKPRLTRKQIKIELLRWLNSFPIAIRWQFNQSKLMKILEDL